MKLSITAYKLRLLNEDQTYPNAGLVEMNVGGEWRLFCGMRDDSDELADILCRNMNFTGGFAMPRGEIGTTNHTKVWVPYIHCSETSIVKKTIFECQMVLNTENILHDRHDFRSNRYKNEYMACLNKPNSYAAAVQCLKL